MKVPWSTSPSGHSLQGDLVQLHRPLALPCGDPLVRLIDPHRREDGRWLVCLEGFANYWREWK